MSDASQGPGWWQATDGKWYPPQEQAPAVPPTYQAAPSPQPAPTYSSPRIQSVPNAQEAVWALVAGILSLTCCGFVAAIVAIIVGGNAKKKIAMSGGTLGGEGMAKVGVILGWVSIGLTVIGVIIWVIALATGNASVHVNTTTN
jgi:hypothetical protein